MTIKFLSLNVWGGRLLDKVISFVQTEKPDICVFQEVHNGLDQDKEPHLRTFSIFKEKLGLPYSLFSATHREKGIERGNATFSKFPLTLVDTIFFDVPYKEDYNDTQSNFEYAPRNMQYSQADINGNVLNIFNVHGIWGADGNDNERRNFMTRTIIDKVKGLERVVLSGDFNLRSDTQAIATIEVLLKNIFKGELTTSFNMKYKSNPGYATAVVDMTFVSPKIQVVNHYCPVVDISDHVPLVSILEV